MKILIWKRAKRKLTDEENGGDDARLLRAKLDGGYDWLHGVQYATKALRRAIA